MLIRQKFRRQIREQRYEFNFATDRKTSADFRWFIFLPKLSVGISCGEMISGNIGSVNLRHLEYTVIGDTVNTAQRLQSTARDGQIVISGQSYQLVKDSFQCKEIGEVPLKHKEKPVRIYEVVD